MLRKMYHEIIRLLKYISAKIKLSGDTVVQPHFYTVEDTVDTIVNGGKSLSRYGDGEFMWMLGISYPSYQNLTVELQDALIKSVNVNDDRIIIGLPRAFFYPDECCRKHKMEWIICRAKILPELKNIINFQRTFADAGITRPWSDRLDPEYAMETFRQLKRIWSERDICIVEGEKTKLGMGNDLFSEAKSVRRIIGPSINAFQKSEKIFQVIKDNISKETLILFALGPTASILTVQLAQYGYQAIDIGHIDIDYMWFLLRSIERINIPGKYVNEAGRVKCVQENKYDEDEGYLNSIIARVE